MDIIDLFSGCGGLSVGFEKAGFTVKKAVEMEPSIAKTYQLNHTETDIIVKDIRDVNPSQFFEKGEADIIIGGPPCQGFSMAGARIRSGFIDDPRNYLFKQYLNIVKEVRPKAFIMENVKGMQTMEQGKIFQEILRVFSDIEGTGVPSYYLNHKLVKGIDFGIPQKRERLIIIGTTLPDVPFERIWEETKTEIELSTPSYFTPVTVRDAIDNLPSVSENGKVPTPFPNNDYQRYLSSNVSVITNHVKSNHSKEVVERIKQIDNGQNYTDLEEVINSVHSGAYGRLHWDEPAPTITTRFDTPAGGRFIHPVENRTLSPREAARIQSFPDDFIFYGTRREISRQIGNAVPPKISYFLAKLIEKILQ